MVQISLPTSSCNHCKPCKILKGSQVKLKPEGNGAGDQNLKKRFWTCPTPNIDAESFKHHLKKKGEM